MLINLRVGKIFPNKGLLSVKKDTHKSKKTEKSAFIKK